jgi:hypothetical protein
MASLTLVRRGTISATSSDGAGPKDSSAFSAIKTASSFVVARIRDRRQDVSVQAGRVSLTDADTSPKDITITSVDVTASEVAATFRENRSDGKSGVVAYLTSATNLRLEFSISTGDTMQVAYEVREKKARRGATLRLLSTTQVRMEWDGTLAAGETIDAAFDVYDLDTVGNELLELDFKLLRLLGFSGENSMEDGLDYDQAGNPVLIRIRTFDTKAHRLLATEDIPDGDPLETGELSRVKATLSWSTGKNRPDLIVSDLLDVAATPGVA